MQENKVQTTAQKILSPIKGELLRGSRDRSFSGISTDSRTVGKGQLFWALKGETFDGHDFVKEAIKRGAAGAVVNKDWIADLPANTRASIIGVPDTLKALGDLARRWRRGFEARVAVITGSGGKTTTKEMTYAILSLEGLTLKNEGNFNNLIGLPLSLFLLDTGHRYAVLEMGMNRPGEIGRLTEIADPDIGLITNVGRAHLEGVGSIEGVARAKVELLDKMAPRALAVLNGDDRILMQAAAAFRKKPVTFGQGLQNTVRAEKIRNLGREGFSFDIHWKGKSFPVKLRVAGYHNVYNALAAAAIALSLDIPKERIQEGLSRFEGIKGRFKVVPLPDGSVLVDDTYNSNPSSLQLALRSLKALASKDRKVIVGLGEMLELGEETENSHVEAGEMVAEAGADWLVALGDHAPEMIRGALHKGFPRRRAIRVKNPKDMGAVILELMKPGDLVFLKASHRIGLERVAERLKGKA
ncbi:MAG TPA: UDP-N-acetylmuramoyl-tripeptide--D-alanyl-D-alanine ligase [Desulfatiglandales bacterium]|nr:UDP-N-acetylmuramoyl-tripeptide--D-alanyl-D-alanine ligase [Desulfatiglandales bacterium]